MQIPIDGSRKSFIYENYFFFTYLFIAKKKLAESIGENYTKYIYFTVAEIRYNNPWVQEQRAHLVTVES